MVTMTKIDDVVQKELSTNMQYSNVMLIIETVFVLYYLLLRREGLPRTAEGNQKAGVDHVLSAIRPDSM